jgi:imidazolonepropionase-like amidohydrolase
MWFTNPRAGLDRTGCEQYDELVMAIRCSRLFTGNQFSEGPATVLLDRGKIVGVETGHTQLNESWQVAEYPNATVLPGLIDTHVHLVADSEVGALDRVSGLGDEELDAVITDGLRRQLAAGVTTVRDLGDRRYAVVTRRDVQRAGRMRKPEPTIMASGPPLTSVGGHCHFLGGEVANRDQISAAMRERVQRGVDVVKVMAGIGPWVAHGNLHLGVSQLEDAGFSPTEAVAAATSEAARVCGLEHRKGLIRKGYDADLIVVDGDLQTDLTALQRVRLVVLAGKSVG